MVTRQRGAAASATPAFPDGFLFGVSTSAYQIEGSLDADGRGRCIWDDFAELPGAIEDGSTAAVACDGYRRALDDVALLSEIGVGAYRFSIGWPRIQPDGTGQALAAGLDHYDRLIDVLLAAGIRPLPTLYHWDLPSALQRSGGWDNRETAKRFADFAGLVAARYRDRVQEWITINEPWIIALCGHRLGLHAPGHIDLAESVRVNHHLLLAHALARQAIRDVDAVQRVGITLNLIPCYPATDSAEDAAATWGSDGYVNRWYLDPLSGRGYPVDMVEHYARAGAPMDMVVDGDMEVIAAGFDFLGLNYYTRRIMSGSAPDPDPFGWKVVAPPDGADISDIGAESVPWALRDLLVRLDREYGPAPVYITENGAAYHEQPAADGIVHDERRIDYLRGHLAAVAQAIALGADVRGYFCWSLMDNWEWAMGYPPRFGLVHVDYATGRRTIKDSGRYYASVIAARGPR
jgi:beta-glucosidase